MKLLNIKKKLVNKNVSKYLIQWDEPSRSQLQFQVKQFFKPYWSPYIVYEEFPVYGTKLKVDIFNASLKIAIEVNGPQHQQFHFFHNKQPLNFLEGIKRDYQKYEWLEINGIHLIEINHDEVPTLSKTFLKEKFSLTL